MSKPVRDPQYLSWIRKRPCIIGKDCAGRIEAAHTPGQRGMAQKASDHSAVPFCTKHHRQYHSIGWRDFESFHQIVLRDIVSKLNERPKVKLYGERWTALYGAADEYDLGPKSIGTAEAIRRAVNVIRDLRGVA